MNEVTGINEDRINNLILEIGNYQDEVSNIFNSIEDTVNNLYSGYVCEAGSVFSRKFDTMKRNFPTVKKNMETYAEDLIRAKDNTARVVTNASSVVQTGISNISDVTRKIIQ